MDVNKSTSSGEESYTLIIFVIIRSFTTTKPPGNGTRNTKKITSQNRPGLNYKYMGSSYSDPVVLASLHRR